VINRERKRTAERERQKVVDEQMRIEGESKLIANFHKAKHTKFLSKLTSSADEKRKEADYSFTALDVLNIAMDPSTNCEWVTISICLSLSLYLSICLSP
jgi:hypothetical protein